MTIRVQGETYNSREEVLTAIGELSATLEDMPESSKERADVVRHIDRLMTAVSDELPPSPSSPTEPQEAEQGDSVPVADTESPAPEADAEPGDDPDDDPVPPGYVLCPVCKQGMLSEDAPVSRTHERCDGCNGYGKVLTGSHVSGHETVDCNECLGNGYITARSTYNVTNATQSSAAPAPAWPGSTWNETEQRWEPPAGDPPWTGAEWDAVRGAYA